MLRKMGTNTTTKTTLKLVLMNPLNQLTPALPRSRPWCGNKNPVDLHESLKMLRQIYTKA